MFQTSQLLLRGSLEALEEKDREQYVALMQDCLREDFSYILSGFEYDPDLKSGPPPPPPTGHSQGSVWTLCLSPDSLA